MGGWMSTLSTAEAGRLRGIGRSTCTLLSKNATGVTWLANKLTVRVITLQQQLVHAHGHS